jgi:hypothetical protein
MKAQPAQVSIAYDPESIDAPVLEYYLRYWRAKRGCRALPLRSELRPAEIKAHLRSIALVEALPESDDFRFRLIGTGVAQHLLAHATGRTVREIYASAETSYVEGIVRLHQSVCRKKMPVLIRARGGTWHGVFYPAFDVLYLPFANEAGDARFILTAYAFPEQRRLAGLEHERTESAFMPSIHHEGDSPASQAGLTAASAP